MEVREYYDQGLYFWCWFWNYFLISEMWRDFNQSLEWVGRFCGKYKPVPAHGTLFTGSWTACYLFTHLYQSWEAFQDQSAAGAHCFLARERWELLHSHPVTLSPSLRARNMMFGVLSHSPMPIEKGVFSEKAFLDHPQAAHLPYLYCNTLLQHFWSCIIVLFILEIISNLEKSYKSSTNNICIPFMQIQYS